MTALCDSRNMNQRSLLAPTLGTPLSTAAVKAMLLGAGELGKEVIIPLQRFGVEVIAVDRYANAPGAQGVALARANTAEAAREIAKACATAISPIPA